MKNHYLLTLVLFSLSLHAQLAQVPYKDGSQKLGGLYAKPDKAAKGNAGVLILPAWRGIDDHSKETATRLAKLGYHAFIADIYGEGNYPQDNKQAGEKAGFYKKNYKDYQRRISLALQELIRAGANAEKVAIIGYCFGGTGALEAARAGMPVQGVVSIHGGLGTEAGRKTETIKTKILVCHGADDFFVPQEEITSFQKEMRDSKADWQMIYYADAVHAFTEPAAGNDKTKGTAYNEKAAKRSWEHMLVFFDEIFNR
ncbi:MAG TPA: dienelactone hydrolase family protein [Flavobacterium sp.]|jgi:dienelactone hydrolase